MEAANDHDDDKGLVPPKNACPDCGERDVDKLNWHDDDYVICQSCGKAYQPGKENNR